MNTTNQNEISSKSVVASNPAQQATDLVLVPADALALCVKDACAFLHSSEGWITYGSDRRSQELMYAELLHGDAARELTAAQGGQVRLIRDLVPKWMSVAHGLRVLGDDKSAEATDECASELADALQSIHSPAISQPIELTSQVVGDPIAVAAQAYVAASALADAAMVDGGNVHGALSGLVGARDNLAATLSQPIEPQGAVVGEDDSDLVKCSECAAIMELVRPGKYQHPACSHAALPVAVGAGEDRWVTQTKFYDPTQPMDVCTGNCTEAALASLMDIPLDEVQSLQGLRSPEYWDALEAFVESKGYTLRMKPADFIPHGYYLADGPSERGCGHFVVMRNGKLAHDPHPSRAGLKEIERVWTVTPATPAGKGQS